MTCAADDLASDTLTSLTFSSTNAGNPQGAPFLAGLTTATESVAAVPEASTWATMVGGFGMVGGALKRRQRTTVSFTANV